MPGQKVHAAFVTKLYSMVDDESTKELITWSPGGCRFQVKDPAKLASEILPKYFKHGNWQSFVRQLNMYGFHKVVDAVYVGLNGEAQVWEFEHPHFKRGQLKELQLVKRRSSKYNQHGANSSKPSSNNSEKANCQLDPNCHNHHHNSNSDINNSGDCNGQPPHKQDVEGRHGDGCYNTLPTQTNYSRDSLIEKQRQHIEALTNRIAGLESRIMGMHYTIGSLLSESMESQRAERVNRQAISQIIHILGSVCESSLADPNKLTSIRRQVSDLASQYSSPLSSASPPHTELSSSSCCSQPHSSSHSHTCQKTLPSQSERPTGSHPLHPADSYYYGHNQQNYQPQRQPSASANMEHPHTDPGCGHLPPYNIASHSPRSVYLPENGRPSPASSTTSKDDPVIPSRLPPVSDLLSLSLTYHCKQPPPPSPDSIDQDIPTPKRLRLT
ncbi:Flocculation suppression protein [Spiromyces aspiralis]|uniref:Flocculation suppression protein n=1 Tax=Spiromyces aspiralis TaxID=68401 RepID=A0ACC1HRN9_9FUNG|nr:Flocculation suppression protein [Spiromyces aspiralis]